jgi:hypothetical protein
VSATIIPIEALGWAEQPGLLARLVADAQARYDAPALGLLLAEDHGRLVIHLVLTEGARVRLVPID